jgi:hypothetical protein
MSRRLPPFDPVTAMRRLGFVVLPLAVLSLSSTSYAHKMELVATLPADRGVVRVMVGFEGDEPAEGARVRMLDAAGVVVVEGTSDAHGVCELPRPGPGEYTLVANDGDGHQVKEKLSVPVESESETLVIGSRTSPGERFLYALLGLLVIGLLGVGARWVMRKLSVSPPGSG